VCIFAYGQTGSGKSFTISGSQEHPGLIRQAVWELFRLIRNGPTTSTFTIKVRPLWRSCWSRTSLHSLQR